ncbi:MAG: tetratricopeptide repeat protein, partial [Chitinophagaceae bacterium]
IFFSMWLLIVLLAIKVIRKTRSDAIRILVILMLSGLTAFATDSMFSFPTERIEHSLYLILMGGIILGCYVNFQNDDSGKSLLTKRTLMMPAISIILFNLFLGIKKYYFELHWKRALNYNNEKMFAETLDEVAKGKNAFFVMDVSGNPLELFSTHAYKEMKNYEAALREIRKAAMFHPNNSRIYSEWGTIYTDMKQYDKAIEYYNRALKLTPRFDIVLKNLAVNYFSVGNYKGCIDALGKVKTEGDAYLTGLLSEAKRIVAADKK